MKTIDLISLEAAQTARKAKALELANQALRLKAHQRSRNRSPDVHQPNIYQLYVSGRPTEEFKEMTHTETVIENKHIYKAFQAKVVEAIEAGGRYDGKLSQWRIYKHHSEKEVKSDAARKARGRAISKLNDALKINKKIRLR